MIELGEGGSGDRMFVLQTNKLLIDGPRHKHHSNKLLALVLRLNEASVIYVTWIRPSLQRWGGGFYLGRSQLTNLHHATDDHGQHVERETQDVEEGQWHEGLLGIEHVVLVNQHVHSEGRQGDLCTYKGRQKSFIRICSSPLTFYLQIIRWASQSAVMYRFCTLSHTGYWWTNICVCVFGLL